jgi:hypothetical protein
VLEALDGLLTLEQSPQSIELFRALLQSELVDWDDLEPLLSDQSKSSLGPR